MGAGEINIELLDVDKAVAEPFAPVIHLDKIGFFYCKRGLLRLQLDDAVYNIHEGSIYIYPPFSQTYILYSSDNLQGVVVVANFDFVLSALNRVSDTEHHIYIRQHPLLLLNDGQRKRIEELISVITDCKKEQGRVLLSPMLSVLGQALCYEIMEIYCSQYPVALSPQKRQDKVFQNFLKNLHINFRENREVAFYASLQCLTPRYFATLIRQISGKSPGDWINTSVIAEAKRLLADPNKSIKEIAETLNFANQSFFGRYFKQHTGVSPTDFRNRKRR